MRLRGVAEVGARSSQHHLTEDTARVLYSPPLLQAYSSAGAWGRVNGSVTSIAFGGQCQPGMTVLAPEAATPGWDGCTEKGGARVYALWLGISVWHAVRGYTDTDTDLILCFSSVPVVMPCTQTDGSS